MLFVILIAGFGLLPAILQSWSIIYDRKTIGRSKITPSGIIIIVSGLTIFVASILQQRSQERKDKEKDEQAKLEQDKRDSILRRNYDSSLLVMKDKFDTSNFKTTAIIAENLGKYGYKFDSTNGSLVKLIKDSSKTKVIVGDDPVLAICDFSDMKGITVTNYTKYKISFRTLLSSLDAGSSDFEIKYSYVIQDSLKNLYYYFKEIPIPFSSVLSKDASKGNYVNIESPIEIYFVYIWARGKYKNLDKTKPFEFNEVYYLNPHGNTTGTVKGETREKIIDLILKRENG